MPVANLQLEAAMAEQRITLAAAVQEIREQLLKASEGGEGQAIKFVPEKVEVELEITFSLEMEAGGGVKIWSIIDLSGKAKKGNETTHKVRLELKPVNSLGEPALIGSTKLEE